jgi:signal transduction histidine kinase
MSRESDPARPGARGELVSEPAPSGPRVVEGDESEYWLDALISIVDGLPVDRGVSEVARLCVERFARLLPECAVGACIVDPALEAPVVEVRLPRGADPDLGRDPARLFPRMSHELVIPLGDDLSDSTLHLAASDPALLAEGSHQTKVARRGARILRTGVLHARAFQRARQSASDLQRLQAQFIQAEKLASLGQIVAGVVHELNNPLTSIVAYSDYLRKKASSAGAEAEDIERLRRIGEAGERILKFSRDLVSYARPTSEVPGPVALHDVIEKALVFCEHEFSEHSVITECDLQPRLPAVRGIAGQLTQVFVNLFTNAAHAMSQQGGRLSVKVRHQPGSEVLIVDVADEGGGIAEQDLEQIFEPFFTTKSDGRGSGLGLSIVREIVKAHGGALSAKSTLGGGSVFSVELPLAAIPASLVPPSK